jgi:hypothetical protein
MLHRRKARCSLRTTGIRHLKAAFTPSASGRYLVSASDISFGEVGRILREHFGDAFPFPRKTVPKWLLWLIGPVVDKTMTRRLISRNVGHAFIADNSRSIHALDVDPCKWDCTK